MSDQRPPAPVTRFDWAPPCAVPVTELRQEDDDSRRVRYVIDLRQGPGGALEVRLRDFHLLELNGEDMTGPEHASQAPGLIVVDAMVPVLYVGPDGALRGVGPLETERVLGELALAPEQAALVAGWRDNDVSADQAADAWRALMGAWVDWPVAPGQRGSEAAVDLVTRRAGTLHGVRERREHLGSHGGLWKLKLTDTLDGTAVEKKYASLVRGMAKMAVEGTNNSYEDGDERLVYTVETDPRTLRPFHVVIDRATRMAFHESGSQRTHSLRDARLDWAHAEGCKR